LRVELSTYFKSKEEELVWLNNTRANNLPSKVIKHLKKNGNDFIKEIPFHAIWDAFWYTSKQHIFVEDSHKAAVVYAYN
jgi:hypothetical protein